MPELIAAALILWGLIMGLRWFARADPKALAKGVKKGAGYALLVTAGALLLFRGNPEAAAALGALGLWLTGAGGAPAFLRHFGWAQARRDEPRRFRSPTLELRQDPGGGMSGAILAGPFAGRRLEDLTRDECIAAAASCRAVDPDGARFLEFYINRRFSGGSATGNGDPHPRWQQPPQARAMSEDDAYQMLGLQKGAPREEIARAHRALMKKVHPDHGGTASLAALLNEAKDVLMRRHR